jgi:HK97 family phage prohead protease
MTEKMDVKLEFRAKAAAELDSRTVRTVAMTYGEQTADYRALSFAPGSITVPDRVVVLLDHDSTQPIGLLSAVEDSADSLIANLKIANTPRGDEVLLEITEGIRDAVSVGVSVQDYAKDDNGLITITQATLNEISVVTFPAIDSARIIDVAAAFDFSSATAEETNPEKENLMDNIVDVPVPSVPEVSAAKVREAFPYRERGGEFSLFRDMFIASTRGGREAEESRARFDQATKMLVLAQDQGDLADIIPTGYRPDLWQGQISTNTPVIDSFTQFTLSDSRPFHAPFFVSATGLANDHVEGVNPTDGSVSVDKQLITPTGIDGQWTGSRELIENSIPGIDMIVMNSIRESVQVKREEDFVTTVLAGATVGEPYVAASPSDAIVENLIAFEEERRLGAEFFLAGGALFRALANEKNDVGTRLNPYLNPANANGQLAAGARFLDSQGMITRNTWSIAGGLMGVRSDAASWWSGLREWRFEEVAGPANIRFAVLGYQAGAVLRPTGVLKFALAGS